MRNIVVAVVAVMAGLLAGPGTDVLPLTRANVVLAAGCSGKFEATALHTTAHGRDAGRAKWIYRPLDAQDWAGGGFASEVLWVATDDDPDPGNTWVEVGITNGWEGQDINTFYTAHGIDYQSGGVYDEARWTSLSPVLGHQYRMSGLSLSADYYQAKVEDLTAGTTAGKSWFNHHVGTVAIAAGSETTCSASRVDRTYVTSPQFRLSGTTTWNNVTTGSLNWDSAVDFIAWCTNPTAYRYYQNPQNDPNICG